MADEKLKEEIKNIAQKIRLLDEEEGKGALEIYQMMLKVSDIQILKAILLKLKNAEQSLLSRRQKPIRSLSYNPLAKPQANQYQPQPVQQYQPVQPVQPVQQANQNLNIGLVPGLGNIDVNTLNNMSDVQLCRLAKHMKCMGYKLKISKKDKHDLIFEIQMALTVGSKESCKDKKKRKKCKSKSKSKSKKKCKSKSKSRCKYGYKKDGSCKKKPGRKRKS